MLLCLRGWQPGLQLRSLRTTHPVSRQPCRAVSASTGSETVELQVEMAGSRVLGRVTGPAHALGLTLWPSTKHVAASTLGVAASDITLRSVTLGSKQTLSIVEASSRTLARLSSERAHIVVSCGVATSDGGAGDQCLRDSMQQLTRPVDQLKADQVDPAGSVDQLKADLVDPARSVTRVVDQLEAALKAELKADQVDPARSIDEAKEYQENRDHRIAGLRTQVTSLQKFYARELLNTDWNDYPAIAPDKELLAWAAAVIAEE
jgi:hypothetical protein